MGVGMKRRVGLANVPNPQGRVDVMLYQLISRAVERLEREQGLVGVREHMLPIVEEAILKNVPGRNLIPQEIAAVLKVCELNRRQAIPPVPGARET